MKHLIILGDGMSDRPVAALGGKTPLEAARTPWFDRLAREGRSGTLSTIPPGFGAGSEVANTAILGYDLRQVYEGRGPLEAASIGYDMAPDDMAMRCNIVTLGDDGLITNHHGGHLKTEEGAALIEYVNSRLGSDKVRFIPGTQYRHLLVIKGGSKYIECAPPHDHPGEPWRELLVRPMPGAPAEPGRMTAQDTADLINGMIEMSREILASHPFNRGRKVKANSIWPWSPGYRPSMRTLAEIYPEIKSGSVITAVDLIRGIGRYAGLRSIDVEGATGLADTNYEGKARAAIEALAQDDFVFLHVEATDEAGHDGDLTLKIQAIESLDTRLVKPIYEAVTGMAEPVCIALLPDHPTPVEERVHRDDPVPFTIWHPGIVADAVTEFSEQACARGAYGHLKADGFMPLFMKTN